jgi:hypothetical protein
MLGPTDFRSLGGHIPPLFLGHGLEPTLPVDLTAFAAYGGHVCGQVNGRYGLCGNDELFRLILRRAIYNPLAKLVRIARAFAFTDCHREFYQRMWNTNEARNTIAKPIRNPAHIHLFFTNLIRAIGRMLKRDCGN